MTSLTSSQSVVALAQSSVTLPIMTYSLKAGVFAENLDRRETLLGSHAFL